MRDKIFQDITAKPFQWEDLHGKNFRIMVNKTVDGAVVCGVDDETGKIYVLHSEIIPEKKS